MKRNKRARGFLNPREGLASFFWEVGAWGGNFNLSDCNRQISLSFPAHRRRALAKIDRIIKQFDAFREAIDAQEFDE